MNTIESDIRKAEDGQYVPPERVQVAKEVVEGELLAKYGLTHGQYVEEIRKGEHDGTARIAWIHRKRVQALEQAERRTVPRESDRIYRSIQKAAAARERLPGYVTADIAKAEHDGQGAGESMALSLAVERLFKTSEGRAMRKRYEQALRAEMLGR